MAIVFLPIGQSSPVSIPIHIRPLGGGVGIVGKTICVILLCILAVILVWLIFAENRQLEDLCESIQSLCESIQSYFRPKPRHIPYQQRVEQLKKKFA